MQLQGTKRTLDKLYFKKVYKRAESTDFILHNRKGSVSFADSTRRREIYSCMRRNKKTDEQGNVFMKMKHFHFGKRGATVTGI